MSVPSDPVPSYPVHVAAEPPGRLSRWLWLVKWVLVAPHVVVLALLWVAFALLTVAALVSIVATGRYPRRIFDLTVGVLRWTWRVGYYSYAALGTDAYPPFSLRDDPGYPASLRVEYPQRLSRGAALVKWWLLALPHYVVLSLFFGPQVGWRDDAGTRYSAQIGLIGVLVLVAAAVLLVRGAYPRGVHDLVLGLNRWAFRVAGYAALMTDVYPPFRLDLGAEPVRRPL